MADTTVESIYAHEIVIDDAYVTTSGSATRVDLTAALAAVSGDAAAAQATADAAQGDATQALSDAADAQATADAAVPKTDTVMLGPVRVSLINTADKTTYSFCPRFAGTLIDAAMVLDGLTTAVGSCGVTISLTNGAVTLSAPLTMPSGSEAFEVKQVTTTGGPWVFAATDFFTFTTTSTNTAATFGGVTLGVTRT